MLPSSLKFLSFCHCCQQLQSLLITLYNNFLINNFCSKNGQPAVPSKNTTISSTHFVGGVKLNHPINVAFSPTIFFTPVISVNKGTTSKVEWSTVKSTGTGCGQGC
jgi:hypothetical protein